MKSPRPNLFLIGSMKSGTSYLSELLGAHPAIFMSSEKEPTYFVDPKVLRRGWPRMWAQGYWRSEDRYLNLFAAAGHAAVIGEEALATPNCPCTRMFRSGFWISIRKRDSSTSCAIR